MKRLSSLLTCALIGLLTLGFSNVAAQTSMAKGPTIWPMADLKWSEIPNSGGVMRSVLWGDADKGAYGAIYKFPAGGAFPLHYHTNAMKVVVISGTWLYTPEGGQEHRLGPGSYLAYGPKDKHVSGPADNAECVFFIEQPGKFDMVPAETPKK
jgi:quercetin dioxygenase-like cupin family protein